jgi:hypothetical protein
MELPQTTNAGVPVLGPWEGARTAALGGLGLLTRMGPDVIEVGYWMRTPGTGRGYITAAARARARRALAPPASGGWPSAATWRTRHRPRSRPDSFRPAGSRGNRRRGARRVRT